MAGLVTDNSTKSMTFANEENRCYGSALTKMIVND